MACLRVGMVYLVVLGLFLVTAAPSASAYQHGGGTGEQLARGYNEVANGLHEACEEAAQDLPLSCQWAEEASCEEFDEGVCALLYAVGDEVDRRTGFLRNPSSMCVLGGNACVHR